MNNEIKKHIKDGFDQLAVDVFDDIRENIRMQDRACPDVSVSASGKKSRFGKKPVKIAAACAAVVMAAGLGTYCGTTLNSYAAEIYIDANPSLIMEVGKDNQVTRIKAGDKSSRKFVKEFSENLVYPMSVESAVNIAIDELDTEGYISDENMDTVISYCYRDKADADIKDEIRSAAGQSMKKGSYIVQDFKDTEELDKAAEANDITPGKCYYIEKLAADHELTLESCAGKSIAEIQMEADRQDAARADETKPESQTDSNNMNSGKGTSMSSDSSTKEASKQTQASKNKDASGKSSTAGASASGTADQKQPSQKPSSAKETAASTASSTQSASSAQEKSPGSCPAVAASVCTSDGYIRVHFSKRVNFASDLKIIVTDSEGQILRSRLVCKKMTFIKLRAYGIEENRTYSVTIAGVKGENAQRYRSVTATVKAKGLE